MKLPVLILAVGCLTAGVAIGQTITPFPGGDGFGRSVSLDGDVAFIGGWGADTDCWAIPYRYDGTGWIEGRLVNRPFTCAQSAGFSVSVSGDAAVVTAPWADTENGEKSGVAYVFRDVGWAWDFEAELLASDGQGKGLFAHAVTIDGDVVIASGPQESAAAYVYRYDGAVWNEEAKLVPSLGQDQNIDEVDLDGDVAVVGAPSHVQQGSAYVYRYDGAAWNEKAKLVASDGTLDDGFGRTVAVDGDVIAAGGGGGVYVFRFDGSVWTEEAKIVGRSHEVFGGSVSVSGNRILVGASGANNQTGAAYLFERNGAEWVEIQRLAPTDDVAFFGRSISLSGNRALIGCSWGIPAEGPKATGMAYLYDWTAVSTEAAELPDGFRLHAAYPNPFNPSTEIRFDLPTAAYARLVVSDLLGREVARLTDTFLPAGSHTATWDATGLPSGVYVYSLTTGGAAKSRSAVLLR